jgi:hypothetical protein
VAATDREILVALLAMLEDATGAGTGAAPAPDRDAAELLRVARHHRLTALLAAVAGDRLPQALAETCRRDRLIATAHNSLLAEVAEECLTAFAVQGIDGLLLKGLAYDRTLYREAGARPTGDADILVRGDRRRAAFAALDQLGFEPRAAAPGFDQPDYHEVAWTRGGVSIDLHLALAPPARARIDHSLVWAAAREIRFGATRAFVLAPAHAAVFHALHMAIDHFDVPAMYLLDLARLLPGPADTAAADATAIDWRCARSLATSRALAAAFLPAWAAHQPAAQPVVTASARAQRIVSEYGTVAPLPRPEQIRRKIAHFDSRADAARYLALQIRRNARELVERAFRRRSPRARLGL